MQLSDKGVSFPLSAVLLHGLFNAVDTGNDCLIVGLNLFIFGNFVDVLATFLRTRRQLVLVYVPLELFLLAQILLGQVLVLVAGELFSLKVFLELLLNQFVVVFAESVVNFRHDCGCLDDSVRATDEIVDDGLQPGEVGVVLYRQLIWVGLLSVNDSVDFEDLAYV